MEALLSYNLSATLWAFLAPEVLCHVPSNPLLPTLSGILACLVTGL